MRKALAFCPGREFVDAYTDFFARNGLKLEKCKTAGKADPSPDGRPVLVVLGSCLGSREETALAGVLAGDPKLPVIYVSDGSGPISGTLKKVRDKARYTLPGDFLKRDMQAAIKGCVEMLDLSEKVSVLEADLGRRMKELSCVLDVTRMLSSSLDSSKVLSNIMEQTRSVVGGHSWILFLADAVSGDLVFNSAKGVPQSRARSFRLKPGEGICGRAALEMSPQIVHDVRDVKTYDKTVEKMAGVEPRSVMAVPIVGNGRLMGVVEIINRDTPGWFTEKDLELGSMLMDQTALAIERSELYQRMEDLAITDDLTKLFNLRYLDRSLEVEIERATRYNLPISLIFMDVDHFKDVNDQFGHLVGSKLLVELSQILLLGLRKVDIVARYGGDEFVIVLPQTGVEAARQIAERLRRSIEKAVFMKAENLSLTLTASFGIASFPEHAATKEDLLRLADEAMYRVKYQTRNDVYIASGT